MFTIVEIPRFVIRAKAGTLSALPLGIRLQILQLSPCSPRHDRSLDMAEAAANMAQ
jgi:hypothetical protein